MSRPWRIRFSGAKYHVTVRGNGRHEVFHDDEYYLRFMEQLGDALEKDGVVLYAYVLMPNHYHLFIETPYGNIQRFMQRLNTAYSMYHRYKYGEPGHCFQGRYGAKLVSGDEYIIRLTRYIHLNPIKVRSCEGLNPAKKIEMLNAYRWSSYRGYVDKAYAGEMVNYTWLELMNRKTERGRMAAYRKYVEVFVDKNDKEFMDALGISRYAVGDEKFIGEVESDLKDVKVNKGVYGDIKWPEGKSIALDEIRAAVAKEFKVDQDLLLSRIHVARDAKKVALELSCRYSHESQRKVGEHFGYKGNGSVLKQRQRLREMLSENDALERKLSRIERQILKS